MRGPVRHSKYLTSLFAWRDDDDILLVCCKVQGTKEIKFEITV